MYADFLKSLREKLTSDLINIDQPHIDNAGIIRQCIWIFGVNDIAIQVTYDMNDKSYEVSDNYSSDHVGAFSSRDADEIIKHIVEAFESGSLKMILDEATGLYMNGEI